MYINMNLFTNNLQRNNIMCVFYFNVDYDRVVVVSAAVVFH